MTTPQGNERLHWYHDRKGAVDGSYVGPTGKPWQNGTDESFSGRFRAECLSMEWFRSRQEAVAIIESWRRHYNEVRPHSSLAYLTPMQFKAKERTATSTRTRAAILRN